MTTGLEDRLWGDARTVNFEQAVLNGKVIAPESTPVVLQGAARGSVVVEACNTIVYFKALVEKEATAHDFFECTAIEFGFLSRDL
jgi:hypothetical protein